MSRSTAQGGVLKMDAAFFAPISKKGADEAMAVFRVEKNKGYTVMSNHHLRNVELTL